MNKTSATEEEVLVKSKSYERGVKTFFMALLSLGILPKIPPQSPYP